MCSRAEVSHNAWTTDFLLSSQVCLYLRPVLIILPFREGTWSSSVLKRTFCKIGLLKSTCSSRSGELLLSFCFYDCSKQETTRTLPSSMSVGMGLGPGAASLLCSHLQRLVTRHCAQYSLAAGLQWHVPWGLSVFKLSRGEVSASKDRRIEHCPLPSLVKWEWGRAHCSYAWAVTSSNAKQKRKKKEILSCFQPHPLWYLVQWKTAWICDPYFWHRPHLFSVCKKSQGAQSLDSLWWHQGREETIKTV